MAIRIYPMRLHVDMYDDYNFIFEFETEFEAWNMMVAMWYVAAPTNLNEECDTGLVMYDPDHPENSRGISYATHEC